MTTTKFRDDGWDSFVNDVSDFCEKHDTGILNMEDDFIDPRKPSKKKNQHYQLASLSSQLFLYSNGYGASRV